jgi:GT2 family glycosyltransferase
MTPISFCIASAKDEKEYTKLLLKSLKSNTNIFQHEILIFIDSDNQNTYEALLDIKSNELPNIKIYRNTSGFPIGSQRNVSLMFNAALNDIVCYLQSDMVVGKDFDKHVIDNINENTVLSCARIEPPLHPGSPEKIVKDFGIVPEEFKYDEFNQFVDQLQKENRPNVEGHFAPFAVYKNLWFDKLGGFDTQFRCSREDSDSIIRMRQNNINIIQSWNACVYHFTCVSSRGKDWFKKDDPNVQIKNQLQEQADKQELKRFIRKWGYFGHYPKPVYNIAFNINIDRYVNFELLKHIEPYCKKLYLNNLNIVNQLISQVEFDAHYYSNLRWRHSDEHWENIKHLFNPTKFSERIQITPTNIKDDIIVSFDYSSVTNYKLAQPLIENIQEIVHQNDIGTFEYEGFRIEIKAKNNIVGSFRRHNDIDLLLNEQEFIFE